MAVRQADCEIMIYSNRIGLTLAVDRGEVLPSSSWTTRKDFVPTAMLLFTFLLLFLFFCGDLLLRKGDIERDDFFLGCFRAGDDSSFSGEIEDICKQNRLSFSN